MHAQHAQRVWRPPGIHLAIIDRLMRHQWMTIQREREGDPMWRGRWHWRCCSQGQASDEADGCGFDSFGGRPKVGDEI